MKRILAGLASMVAAISGVVVLMSGESAVTVSVSETFWSASLKGMSSVSPMETTTFSRCTEPNPAMSTRTVYSDGFRFATR